MKKIKLFSLFISVCLLLLSMTYQSCADTLYKGDTDLDGSITAADALLVLKHAAKLNEVNVLIADIDEDLTVNANDALYILKYAGKLITEFPGGNTVDSGDTETTPEPTETVSPAPTETTSPMPSEDPTPVPTLTPIENIKEYVKTNGFDGENGEKVYGYSYEDDTVKATISYIPTEDKLIFALNYEEITDTETMFVAITMDYDNGFEYARLVTGYSYDDFRQNYTAQAPIIPAEITSETKYDFSEVSSENLSDEEKTAILSVGDMYMETALYLWDSILTNDMSVTLADIGFTNYSGQ